jgi:hypothetical protein
MLRVKTKAARYKIIDTFFDMLRENSISPLNFLDFLKSCRRQNYLTTITKEYTCNIKWLVNVLDENLLHAREENILILYSIVSNYNNVKVEKHYTPVGYKQQHSPFQHGHNTNLNTLGIDERKNISYRPCILSHQEQLFSSDTKQTFQTCQCYKHYPCIIFIFFIYNLNQQSEFTFYKLM